jgi:hypothetical protein
MYYGLRYATAIRSGMHLRYCRKIRTHYGLRYATAIKSGTHYGLRYATAVKIVAVVRKRGLQYGASCLELGATGRNRRLCRGVAPAPGTPPEDGAARRNPAADGFNMLVVSTALSRGPGACELYRASQSTPGPTFGRPQKRSPVMGRLRPSLLRHSIARDRRGRFADRPSMAALLWLSSTRAASCRPCGAFQAAQASARMTAGPVHRLDGRG